MIDLGENSNELTLRDCFYGDLLFCYLFVIY